MAVRHQLGERIIPLPGEEYYDRSTGLTHTVTRVTDRAIYTDARHKGGAVLPIAWLVNQWAAERGKNGTLRRTKEHPASTIA